MPAASARLVRPTPRPGVLDIAAYVPGKSAASPGARTLFKLSSNETPLGPSPAAIGAFRATAEHLDLYPDGASTRLREAIAARFGLDPARIVCGAGSDEILNLLAQAFIGPGDEGLFTEHGFLVYKIAVMAAGGIPVVAPEKGLVADVDAILERLTPRTRIVFLANPNNPTGTYLPFEAVKRLHAGLRPDVLLVLDAAYAEYVSRNDYSSGLELAATCDNVVMTRTFSKIHGLAGLRLGWCYASSAVCDALNRIRGPFNVNAPALEAGIAAINDLGHLETARVHNDTWLPWTIENIRGLGLEVVPSVGNFVLIRFPNEGPHSAEAADMFLSRHGLVLRAVGAYGLPDCLRMTIGSEEANRLVVATLGAFLEGERPRRG